VTLGLLTCRLFCQLW